MADLNQVRTALLEIDIAVHNLWNLGKNMAVGWRTDTNGIQVCMAPCYQVLGHATANPRLVHGGRQMDTPTFSKTCKILRTRPLRLALPFKIGSDKAKGEVGPSAIDSVIKRYSIMHTDHRAVILFDIVGFATATPIEQVAQSVALEYSINSAAEQMSEAGMEVELARSTAGDGYLYVWNRHSGVEADLRTYTAMLLALINNAMTHQSGAMDRGLLPALRTGFTVGSHYSYHPVEGTRPRSFEYASGQVTITLARLLTKALTGQVLIGSFERPSERSGTIMDSLVFLARAEKLLSRFTGGMIGERAVRELRSIVSGGTIAGKRHSVVKYRIDDKHGFHHEAFNVRMKMTREGLDPLEVGLRSLDLGKFEASPGPYEIPVSLTAGSPVAEGAVG